MSLILRQVSKGVKRAEAAVLAERLLGRVLNKMLRREWLVSFVNCVRELMFVDGLRVFEVGVRMLFVMSELKSREFLSSLDSWDEALNVLKACRTDGGVLHDQRA